ncbi:MAG TPA: RNA polymerase sigma factor [Candidatus Eisenbacteria bacterium]|jgi:RNA polymerase sigma-70 factor (ECF subfamily)|nr:RNA polymerase sigma factor [Candidatus Eisenbacteria bacterium]
MDERQDAQLIAAHLAGDEASLGILVTRHLPSLYSFALRWLGDAHDADDVCQESFVRAWKNLRKFDRTRNFRTWLFAIAKNAALDHLKKKKTLPFSRFEDEDGANPVVDGIEDPAPLAPELLERADIAADLAAAMDKLPPGQRMVLYLHYNDHLTFREIGESLGEPLHTVKSRHHRGLIALKGILEGRTENKE